MGLEVLELGTVEYGAALELQQKRVEARRSGAAGDALLLLEHPPVITLGRRADTAHVLASPASLAARGIGLHTVSRGGDVTFHGPGQLVGYLVVDLAARGVPDVHAFLRSLESGLIEALDELGVACETRAGWTGVFVRPRDAEREPGGPGAPPRKIASIGVGVRGWVTYHGFALNVTLDPAAFSDIVPCGLQQVRMTSLARELGADAPPDLDARARAAVRRAFLRSWS